MEAYPARLHHDTPGWVKTGAFFHIRIRLEAGAHRVLTDPQTAGALLNATRSYHERNCWWCGLMLLMLDHLHALLAFPANLAMSGVIRNWKRGTTRSQGLKWQVNYFDHRIRNDREASETWTYVRNNPVAKGLCAAAGDWPCGGAERRRA